MSFLSQGRRVSERESGAVLVRSGATAARPLLQEGAGGGQDAQLPETDVVELYYSTGWQDPTILYSVQGGEWERIPMHQVATCTMH